ADKPGLDVKSRPDSFHLHRWPAIDQTLTTFPDPDGQTAGIKDILDNALTIINPHPITNNTPPNNIYLNPPNILTIHINTISTNHIFPNNTTQNRRSWLEVKAFDAGGTLLFSSNNIPNNKNPKNLNNPTLIKF